jgi:low temperature requirement protein LtrA
MSSETSTRPRLRAVMREGETVTSLELFFDLVFVLALTQCTTLVAVHATWLRLAHAILILAVLWWSWVGYAWLTSVVNPEEGAARLVIFAAMAGLLVAAISVPGAFAADALTFAVAYAVVRAAHIALFLLASRENPGLRRSVNGLAVSTTIGVVLLLAAAFVPSGVRVALWIAAIVIDAAGPYFFGADGWTLVPGHFAERHGGLIIIALGESIIAIGAGATGHVDAGVIVAALLGMVVAGGLWWTYFDVVAIVAERRLIRAQPGRERNEIARDSYSLLHFPMIAGIALVAVGLKKSFGHISEPLGAVSATAMIGGAALYMLAHIAFRWRNIHTLNRQRLVAFVALLVLLALDLALTPEALVTIAMLAAVLTALIVYEVLRFAEMRDRVRHLEPLES